MIYGYNALRIPDKSAFTLHISKLKPPAVLLYNTELDYGRELKAMFPQMEVIMRNWPDGNVHQSLTPSQWLDKRAGEAEGDLMLATTNEPGLDDDLINWHVSLMRLCIPRKIRLCLLNLGTGTWNINDMPRLRPLLELAGQHRDLFVVGLHSYAGGIITSGIRGGVPDDAGVIPGAPGGLDLTRRVNWPQVKSTDTFFHIGRHKFILDYCQQMNIPAPRIGLTETGFDSLGDIGQWLQAIGNRTGHPSINGWRTLKEYWSQIFPDWSPEMAYVEQFKWAAPNLLQGVEFALFFAYGDDGSWNNYNVENSAIPALLEKSVTDTQEHPVVAPPPPIVIPPPVVDKPSPPAPASDDIKALLIRLDTLKADFDRMDARLKKVESVIDQTLTTAGRLLDLFKPAA